MVGRGNSSCGLSRVIVVGRGGSSWVVVGGGWMAGGGIYIYTYVYIYTYNVYVELMLTPAVNLQPGFCRRYS